VKNIVMNMVQLLRMMRLMKQILSIFNISILMKYS